MTLEAGKELDRRWVWDWLNEVYVTPSRAFNEYTDDELKMFAHDALVLLKEREAEWIEYPECLAYDGAYSDSHIVCSACKYVFNIIENCTEEFHYCPHCGAKMKGK